MTQLVGQSNVFVRFIHNKNLLYTLIAVAVFAAISWAYFYPDVVDGNILKQHDVQQGIAIGQEVKAFTEATGETSRWTNSLFSGMPNFQISPSYESSKFLNIIGKIYSLWFPSPVNLLFIMMVGFYILLLSFKVRWYIAIPGAIAYAFSSYFFILIGAGHIWKYITLAYIPPTIAGIIWAYRGRYVTGSIVAALFASLQIASNHVQMSYYFLFLIVGLAIAFLILAIKEKKIGQWGISTGALVVAAIIAVAANSPNLYNTYEYSKETMRGGHSELTQENQNNENATSGLNKDYITAWSYGIDETLSFLVPNINGGATIKPEKGRNNIMSVSKAGPADEYFEDNSMSAEEKGILGQFPQYFGDQPMTNGPVYLGALIFALFLVGCFIVKGPIKWALIIVTILTIFLSWGHNMMWLTDIFIDYFPMYNKFRTVSSILVVAEFTIPLLAMLALQKLLTDKDALQKYKNTVIGCFGFCAIICVVLYFVPQLIVGDGFSQAEVDGYIAQGAASQYPKIFAAVESIRLAMVSADALRTLIILAISFCILWFYARKSMSSTLTCVLLTFVILGDLFFVNKRYLNTESFTPKPRTEATITPRPVDNQILQDTTMNYRVMDYTAFGEAMPSYFHKMIGGYHAAKLSRYQDLMDKHITGKDGMTPQVIAMLNTKYVIMGENEFHETGAAMGNAWLVDEIKYVNTPDEEINELYTFNPFTTAVSDKKFESVLGNSIPVKVSTDTIFETSYAPNKLTYNVKSSNGGLAVFSEVYFPWGWEATIDGTPVEIGRVNYVLRAIKVPAGDHTIVFSFDPQSVKITETLAFIAIGILYLGLIVLILSIFFRDRNRKDTIEIND